MGGSCAQPVVIREALHALGDGQPRLLRLSKDAPAEGRRADGIVELQGTHFEYGLTVKIRHAPQFTTLYAHMSHFAAGMAVGRSVRKVGVNSAP